MSNGSCDRHSTPAGRLRPGRLRPPRRRVLRAGSGAVRVPGGGSRSRRAVLHPGRSLLSDRGRRNRPRRHESRRVRMRRRPVGPARGDPAGLPRRRPVRGPRGHPRLPSRGVPGPICCWCSTKTAYRGIPITGAPPRWPSIGAGAGACRCWRGPFLPPLPTVSTPSSGPGSRDGPKSTSSSVSTGPRNGRRSTAIRARPRTNPVLWRRLELMGDEERLRWIPT
jgi:hypothetical protein